MSEEDVLAEIEQEIERTKKQKSEDFEIEVVGNLAGRRALISRTCFLLLARVPVEI